MAKSSILRKPDIQAFIDIFAKDIADGVAAIFAGAGLSVASGYVNWAELLRDIAAELSLDVDRETNLVAVAQYHLNERQNRSRINQKIIDEFSQGHSVNENHEILARLPIATYWTTNYDKMIESALEAADKIVDVKHAVNHLKTTRRGRHAIIYKMHGDVNEPDQAVLTKDDYEGYFRDKEAFVTALAGDLVSKTILFIGFSFTDPNIDYVMSRVRVVLSKKPKQHYCILRRESRREREKKADFEYRLRQQEYFVKDLARLGIHALLVDDYSDVTIILRALEARYRTRTVFMSGSAHEFGDWKPDDAAKLIESISEKLIENHFNIITGFGLGVGPSVIAGAFQTILRSPKRYSQNQLQAFPFPVGSDESKSRRQLYSAHRKNMISRAGIAIFVFGNKRSDRGNIIIADGMREELALAKSMGLKIIAVGSTGWVAKEISEELAQDLSSHTKSFQKAFAVANNSKRDISSISQAVMTMVSEYRKL